MNNLFDKEPPALKNQLFRYAQDLQLLMKQHGELQKRYFALLGAQSKNVLNTIKTGNSRKSIEELPLTWRELITLWFIIFFSISSFGVLCYIFWRRFLQG
jgi:hypothetical protein